MDLISKTLHHIGQNYKDASVVQIGAMDGLNFDDTRGFLNLYGWKSLLVEPVPAIFNELKENFKDRTNYTFEQCAITENDGEIEMLTIPPDVIISEGLHPGYKGMSAIYPLKNGFNGESQRDIDIKTQFGINITVPSLTFDSLLKKHNIEYFDILICDAEGYDWNIFNQLDLTKYRPKFIRLEYINLTDEEKILLKAKLAYYGYIIDVGKDIDAVAVEIYQELQDIEEEILKNVSLSFNNVVLKYGSDKIQSGYNNYYSKILESIRHDNINHLEIGLGTLMPEIESSFAGVTNSYPHYKPSACLRMWREYFTNGNIYGMDVAEDCMIEEERIKTFLMSSLDSSSCITNLKDLEFDVIIDDGLHTAIAQITTFRNLFSKVKEGGYYIIEDIKGGGDGINVFNEYNKELMEVINEHECFYNYYLDVSYEGTFLCIRKNYSKRGLTNDTEEFSKNTHKIQSNEIEKNTPTFNVNKNLTIVTGLWDINRTGRRFDHYIENFKKFLDIPQNLFIYIPKEYEYLVWEKRTPENTFVKIYELDDVKNIYRPFWDKTQEIRNNPEWLNLAGWLSGSPQAQLEWYNPIVQSKMFMLNDSSIWNPFNTEYFFWLDAGITNTVPHTHLVENNILDKLTEYGNPFLFLSYPYEANTEIHGFEFDAMNRFAGSKVEYVCRGGLFGGHKQQLNEANSTYYSLLTKTMNQGYMGTEESIFTIMSYNEPDLYRRYELDGNGLIVKFTQAVIDNNVKIVTPNKSKINNAIKYTDRDVDNVKTNLYILTFNFPEQVLHTIKSMEKTPIWLNKPHLVLLDNSTTEEVRDQNREIAKQYNFEYVSLGGNTGICGGRQAAAEHFHESDADFMFFFEDDMTVNPPEIEGQFCRNGFRKYIPNLYNIVHKIMLRDKFDFLKLTFTEVYFDNDKQCTWYNVPQEIRTRDWPDYDKLPVTGLDPNAPLTNFKNMRVFDGLAYLDGEVYYANWPMIVSKEGNKKMFIDTKWGHPFEQTWMSHMYQETKKGNIKPAILLAAPIWHDRIKHYQAHERREN
jgi:FkbM family methyltransferase